MSDFDPQGPNTLSLPFVEALYTEFLRDPASVPEAWRQYFEKLAPEANGFASRPQLDPSFPRQRLFGRPTAARAESNGDQDGMIGTFVSREPSNGGAPAVAQATDATAEFARSAEALVRSYRVRGHMIAKIDPLGRPAAQPPELDPAYYGFTEADLDRPFADDLGGARVPLRQIVERLRHLLPLDRRAVHAHRRPVHPRMAAGAHGGHGEPRQARSRDEQLRILTKLTDAVRSSRSSSRRSTWAPRASRSKAPRA